MEPSATARSSERRSPPSKIVYEITKRYLQVVKTTGPALSVGASGSLASELTFSNWKGKSYLKMHRKPNQPRTPPQVAMRAMMTHLSTSWTLFSDADHDAWQTLADERNISPFNAYQRFNLDRWRNFLAPSKIPTIDTTLNFGGSGWPTPVAVYRGIEISGTVPSIGGAWAGAYFSTPSAGGPMTWDTVIYFQKLLALGAFTWTWRPLSPGTYYITVSRIGIQGRLYLPGFHHTVNVT